MTSSTPELRIEAGGVVVPLDRRTEVPGRGDLRVRGRGHPPEAEVELWIGDRPIPLRADRDGEVSWLGAGWLGQLAGEITIRLGEAGATLSVRPDKLVAEAIVALVEELEEVAEGLAQDVGARSTLAGLRSREHELAALDEAVGLAADAAPAIRRRPLHRAREVVRALPSDRGPRAPRDVRWLATHPVAALRASASGRPVTVVRERRADLDTLENRGVLAAYDRLGDRVGALTEVVGSELARLEAARPAREAFLTEAGTLWSERDQPRHDALVRRRERLEALGREVAALRRRSGLPELRPRSVRMVRTARVDAEPAYWATWRASRLAEAAEIGSAPPSLAPVRALDELWEQWVTVATLRALRQCLGPPDGERLVDPGWFARLTRGPVARWSQPHRTVTLSYEPEIPHAAREIRKLFPGRPWRPDLLVEVRWADGTLDLHVLDAKYRLEQGGPPKEALRELWWSYGEGIGDARGQPLVRSVWVVGPGDGVWPVAPGMLAPDWPLERLRGGCISIRPGQNHAMQQVLRLVVGDEQAR